MSNAGVSVTSATQSCRPAAEPRPRACSRAAAAQSTAARTSGLCSRVSIVRVEGASRRRAAPRSQSVGPPKGGKSPAPVTLGRRSKQVQPSFRMPPARPNPSFNLSANSRSLGPHSAVVYRRTVRPKHPAVVARLTQTLGVTNADHSSAGS